MANQQRGSHQAPGQCALRQQGTHFIATILKMPKYAGGMAQVAEQKALSSNPSIDKKKKKSKKQSKTKQVCQTKPMAWAGDGGTSLGLGQTTHC